MQSSIAKQVNAEDPFPIGVERLTVIGVALEISMKSSGLTWRSPTGNKLPELHTRATMDLGDLRETPNHVLYVNAS